ncbi:CUB domain-containing protein 2-like [Penaeus indicus]|uniref:CUB domain-containing protein 2-like n=1 Tax=Penaeus indicus TaxID=29960 RepID=UPI00300D7DEB
MTPNTAAESCAGGSVCCNPTRLQAFRQTLELDGFEVDLRVSICAQANYNLSFEGDCVQVHSPNYNHPYNNNEICSFQVTAPSDCEIEVHFCEVSMEKCFYDTLTIDGNTYCGVMNPANWITEGNIASMRFDTDFSQVNRGFKVVLTAVNCFNCSNGPIYVVGTDTVITTNTGGIIHSPGYPGNYPDNVFFTVTINAPAGCTIMFVYNVFDVEFGDTCQFDYFQINDVGATTPWPKYCGTIPPTFNMSATNQVEIVFSTDKAVVAAGFEICFTLNSPEVFHVACFSSKPYQVYVFKELL